MSVNLVKGQKVNLSKQRYGLSKLMVGLGWDEVQQKRGLFAPKPQDIDCDAFAILLGYDGHLLNHATKLTECTVFFNNLRWPNGSILNSVPNDVGCIVFAVNIYEAFKRNQHFGMIRNAFIRVVDYDRGVELCRFNLSENYANQTALIAGDIIRTPDGWEFRTDGTAARVESLVDVVSAFAE